MAESEEIPRHHDYAAESRRIHARLSLDVTPDKSEISWRYRWDAEFCTAPIGQGDSEVPKVSYQYKTFSPKLFFDRLTQAASGIEMMLASITDHNWDVSSARDVMSCIINLEEQAKGLIVKIENYQIKKQIEDGCGYRTVPDHPIDNEAE